MKCRICSEDCILVHRGTRDNSDIDVYMCKNCNTKQLSNFCVNDYENGFMNGGEMTEQEIESRVLSCQSDDLRRAEYIGDLIEGKTVLDFGCGFGGFLNEIKERSSNCAGIELGCDERNYMAEKGIVNFTSLEECSGKWDYITLFHVFEHLSEPLKWLSKLGDYLKEDGRIIIEIPNGNDALLELYHNEKFADFTYWSAHLFLYTIESFSMLVDQVEGLEIEKIEQIQRYPLSNHLYWLGEGKPGGQNYWSWLDDEIINKRYKELLEKKKFCDTLLFTLRKSERGII